MIPLDCELSLDQQIGQIFCVTLETASLEQLRPLVQEFAVGTFHTVPWHSHFPILDALRQIATLPFMVSANLECGSQEIQALNSYPSQMAISATDSVELAYRVGLAIGQEAFEIGIDWVFTPVVDVNTQPQNPIINTRSFGDDPERVIRFAKAYVAGLLEAGVLATVKHFPGHGSTKADSHLDCAYCETPPERFAAVDLAPFVALIAQGVPAIMTAHVVFPHLDSAMATFSPRILQRLLREELGFQGLIISDALCMGAVSKRYHPVEAAVKAFAAGCDCLIVSADEAYQVMVAMRALVESSEIPRQRLQASVARVLAARRRLKRKEKPQPVAHWPQVVQSHLPLIQEVSEHALTLVANKTGLLPLQPPRDKAGIFALITGYDKGRADDFERLLQEKTAAWEIPFSSSRDLQVDIPASQILLLVLYSKVRFWSNEIGLPAQDIALLRQQIHQCYSRVVVLVFGNPYLLEALAEDIPVCLVAYDTVLATTEAMIRALFGEISPQGKLPIQLNSFLRSQNGFGDDKAR